MPLDLPLYSGGPMYSPELTGPMREELERSGFDSLRTADEVNNALANASGTTLVVVNSVCGCAAAYARPAATLALQHTVRPDRAYTVFAGVDKDAATQARTYFTGVEPSSPSMALLKDGKLAFMLHRTDIEGQEAESIAARLTEAFDEHCGTE